jgi:hypothetical protein
MASRYTIQKVTTINNKPVYEIRDLLRKCSLYLINNNDYRYVYIDNHSLLPIPSRRTQSRRSSVKLPTISRNSNHMSLISRGIKPILFSQCKPPLNLTNAKKFVATYNKTSKIIFDLNYIYNMEGYVVSYGTNPNVLLLCLRNHEGCIASVELIIINDIMKINSKTDPRYEKRSYNKLLRGMAILIAKELKCKQIISEAQNPISVWLLVNYYNAKIPIERNERFYQFNSNHQPITKDLLKEYEIELKNDRHHIFEIFLEIDVTNLETIRKTKETIENVITTLPQS